VNSLSRSALFSYGLFGLPLALVALPIYVLVPQLYAQNFGLSLTVIGVTLLVARVMDAFVDLPIGLWIDKKNTPLGYAYFILLSLPFLLIGFIALSSASFRARHACDLVFSQLKFGVLRF
jgi:Na+/melibiose symporter-like transporter